MSDDVLEATAADATALAEPAITSELMRAVVEAAPDGILIINSKGRVELVNNRAEVIFGYNRGELLGREIEMLMPERYRGAHIANRLRYSAAPQVRSMGTGLLLHGIRADGSEFPVEISLSPLGSALRVIATVRDVTDRAAAEAHARLIRHTIDAVSADAVLIFAVDTLSFTYVNHGASGLLGYSQSELLAGMTPLHVAADIDDAAMRSLIEPLIHGRVPRRRFVGVVRRADGHDVPVEWIIECPIGEDGRRRFLVAIVRDMSEQVANDRKIRETDEAFRIGFDRAPTGIVLADITEPTTRRIVRANAAFARMLGYEPADLEGKNFSDLSHPDDAELDAAAAEELNSGRRDVYVREKQYRHADGHYVWAELRANILHDVSDMPQRTLAHIIDITDRKERDLEREQRSLELERAAADRQTIAILEDRGRIAHELHDLVIRQLFATGLSLQATADRTDDDTIVNRVLDAVAEIDLTIEQIRTTVFELPNHPST
jgi:PAS domain S-box-containing protein